MYIADSWWQYLSIDEVNNETEIKKKSCWWLTENSFIDADLENDNFYSIFTGHNLHSAGVPDITPKLHLIHSGREWLYQLGSHL